MDCYEIMADLKPGVSDLEFCDAVNAYLGHLQAAGKLRSFRVRRRKFGFSPPGFCEFWISAEFDSLSQLDEAFQRVAVRDPEIEVLHAEVYSRVSRIETALYRDFPDPVRQR